MLLIPTKYLCCYFSIQVKMAYNKSISDIMFLSQQTIIRRFDCLSDMTDLSLCLQIDDWIIDYLIDAERFIDDV